MNFCVAVEGVFENKHLDTIDSTEGVKVTWLNEAGNEATQYVAKKNGIQNWSANLQDTKKTVDK